MKRLNNNVPKVWKCGDQSCGLVAWYVIEDAHIFHTGHTCSNASSELYSLESNLLSGLWQSHRLGMLKHITPRVT